MGSEMAVPLYSPLRSREHTSEAGSPTMEQVLLMPSSRSPSASVSPGITHFLNISLTIVCVFNVTSCMSHI